MYERLLIVFAMMAFLGGMFLLMKYRQIALAKHASRQSNNQTGMATIVYFWSDGCSVCKKAQKPILEWLLAEYGSEHLALIAYNIDEAPNIAIAKKWGVMTLPTTILLDSAGTIRHVNNGLVVLDNLRKQLGPMISGIIPV